MLHSFKLGCWNFLDPSRTFLELECAHKSEDFYLESQSHINIGENSSIILFTITFIYYYLINY